MSPCKSLYALLALLSLPCLPHVAASSSRSQCSANAYVHHFNLNNISGIITSDGPIRQSQNFFSVPDAAVTLSYSFLFRSTSPIVWQQNILLIDLPNIGRVLVDTGLNARVPNPLFAGTGLLMRNLRAIHVSPDSIDVVLLTHGHPDHVAGLVDDDGNRVFRHATVYVGEIEHDFWTADPFINPSSRVPNATLENISGIYRRSLSAYEPDVVLVANATSPLPGVTFLLYPGHTPGHSVIQIDVGGDRKLMCVGDAWFSQPDQVRNPEWVRPVETDGLQGFQSRVALMRNLSNSADLVLAYHEEFPGLGHIVRSTSGFDWVAAVDRNHDVVRSQC